jgi:pimeloyl-ACP methyl ester carboxylesterase
MRQQSMVAGQSSMHSRPELSFCMTKDGTRLAMGLQGTGRTVVMVQLHIGDDLDAPATVVRPWTNGLADCARVVCYDVRGCGLSDRNMDRCTLDTWADDLDAVLNALPLGSEPVALFAHSQGAFLAVQYASLHPERISHLVIYGGISRGRLRRASEAAMVQETQTQREAMRAVSDRIAWVHRREP